MSGPSPALARFAPPGHGFAELRGIFIPFGQPHREGRFGRLFPHLDPRPDVPPTPVDLGMVEGPMDGGTGVDPNASIPAGFTFLGQFLDHDITFDPTSSLEQQNDPKALQNFRTPAFELDSVYGLGPAASPHLYDARNPAKLLLGPSDTEQFDLPRNQQERALLGDPRNDENLIISQLHVAFLKFHNEVVDRVEPSFTQAQRLVRWHYQWIIVHEFLPLTVGQEMVDDILHTGRRIFSLRFSPYAYMPVEFSVAAYRFGHSQVRPFYRLNGNPPPDGSGPLFPNQPDAPPGNDLRGGRRLSDRRIIDWSNFFFTTPTANPQRSQKIDTKISKPLLILPTSVVGNGNLPAELRSLAVRNLLRGQRMGLPSGQDVARKMGEAPLTDEQLGLNGAPAPLWFYVLKEAEVQQGGARLGKVGGRIVAEVFLGLLEKDSESYLHQNPHWKPTLPSATPGDFKMADLLKFAKVA